MVAALAAVLLELLAVPLVYILVRAAAERGVVREW